MFVNLNHFQPARPLPSPQGRQGRWPPRLSSPSCSLPNPPPEDGTVLYGKRQIQIQRSTKKQNKIQIKRSTKKYKYKDQPPLLSSLLLLTTPTRTSAPWSPSKKRQLIQFQFKHLFVKIMIVVRVCTNFKKCHCGFLKMMEFAQSEFSICQSSNTWDLFVTLASSQMFSVPFLIKGNHPFTIVARYDWTPIHKNGKSCFFDSNLSLLPGCPHLKGKRMNISEKGKKKYGNDP